jgi:protein TonB
VEVAPRLDPAAERLAAVPAASEPELALALSGIAPPGISPTDKREASREEALKARYEEELTTLRQELADVRRVAAEEQKPVEDRPFAAVRTPAGEAVATAIPAEVPESEPKTAAGGRVASDQTSRSATGLPAGSPVGDPGPVVESFRSPDEAAGSATRVSPPSAQPEAKAPPKPSPPPRPREPKTRRGDLVTAGPGVVPAQLIRPPSPRYPAAAQRLGRKGVVRVRVLVDENGKPAEVRQVGPEAGMGFDKSALKAAREAVWKPATKNGVKVKMWIDLVIQFKP